MISILVVVSIVAGLGYLAFRVTNYPTVRESQSNRRFIGYGGEHGDVGGHSSGASDCGGGGGDGGGGGGSCG